MIVWRCASLIMGHIFGKRAKTLYIHCLASLGHKTVPAASAGQVRVRLSCNGFREMALHSPKSPYGKSQKTAWPHDHASGSLPHLPRTQTCCTARFLASSLLNLVGLVHVKIIDLEEFAVNTFMLQKYTTKNKKTGKTTSYNPSRCKLL